MEIRAVLFDFGGTLLEYHLEEVMRALLESKGITASTQDMLLAYETVEPAWSRLFSELEDDKRVTDETLRNLNRMIIEHLRVQDNFGNLARYVQENWNRMDHQLPKDLVRRAFPMHHLV